MGELSYGAIKTGVVFGFLRTVVDLQNQFGTDEVAFCFDLGEPKRKQMLECYKQRRHRHGEQTDDEARARTHMRIQVDKLRSDYLPTIGYRNIYAQEGYEADDLIANLLEQIEDEDEAIIVSADGDLLQLLRHNVMIYNPQRHKSAYGYNGIITFQAFSRVHGIEPGLWAKVKALAGCHTDQVPGIPGVGEKTALKYIRGELKPKSVAYKAIYSATGRQTLIRNRSLVKLPLFGVKTAPLQFDAISKEGWESVCEQLGLKSLRGFGPHSLRGARHAQRQTQPEEVV